MARCRGRLEPGSHRLVPGFLGSPVKGALLPAVGSPSQEPEQGHPSLAPCLHKAVPRAQAAPLQAPCHAVQAAVQDGTLPAALLQVDRHLFRPQIHCSWYCHVSLCRKLPSAHDAEAPGDASPGTGQGA